MEQIAFRVTSEVKHLLLAEAKARGIRPSKILREALDERLGLKHESCLDIATRIGVVGRIENLPPDASTNEEYLKDLGRDPR